MSKDYEEVESYRVEGNQYCIADELIESGIAGSEKLHRCGSSDAMSTYLTENTDGTQTFTSYCFSCSQAFNKEQFSKSSYASDFGIEGGIIKEKRAFKKLPKREKITKSEMREVLSYGYEGKGIRGLKDEYCQFFGHVTKLSKDGEPLVRFYPETKDGKLVGYKSRTFPKKFGYENKGLTGVNNDLSGMIKFQGQQFRDIVITGGEEDKVAFYQIFEDNRKHKISLAKKDGRDLEGYLPMPVVSPTTGEGSAIKQMRNNYDFINTAENIYLGLDNDETGLAAMAEIAEIFPKEKVRIIKWSHKDPNNAINNREGVDYSKQAIRDFYNAKPYYRDGIITSTEADSEIEEELMRPGMTLPSFMSDLQKKMANKVPLGYILNWIAESGIGKSTLINEAIRHWVYTSPYKVGILSLELTGAQYMIAMLSREVGKKINLFETPEEAVAFLKLPHVIEARKRLCMTEDGEPRFVILDERDGDLEQVKLQCEMLINKHGCKVLIIDPIQDLFEGVSMDQQNSFLKWMKGVLKRGVTFHNVCHVRKGNTSTDRDGNRVLRELSEDDVHGISAIVKSAGANIFMSRDKYAENDIAKNTTYITLGKCRWTGITGRVGSWYYHLDSHTMYDLKTYFKEHPEELPAGYDLDANPFKRDGKDKSKNKDNKNTPIDNFNIDIGNGVVL